MNLPDLSNLELDKWWKLTGFLGIILNFGGLFFPTQAVPNGLVITFGAGLFRHSVGRWQNYKPRSWHEPGGIVTVKQRDPDWFGYLLEAIGILILAHATYTALIRHTALGTIL